MPLDPNRVESVFHAARAAADPAAYAAAACADDPELRERVERLLAADAELRAGGPPAADSLPATSEFGPAGLGTVVAGRYTLAERIGEGGMGEVWVARQTEPVRRRVAVKLIRPGMDSKAVLARFEQERQALALMDHTNIARVFDGGLTADGRPFFVMELVNGLPLTRFCDEARLGIRGRLELFVPICQAVQHAHQKGIVHRDLKPANILVTLVDGRPVPKVIDFGVAKATAGRLTDASLATQFGAVVGTLEYMAPEQAGFSGQDVDTRADVYSLGVIVYELLTGLRPLDAHRLGRAALAEVIRLVQEAEPAKPSTRLSTDAALPSLAAARQVEPRRRLAMLRGELDWVVMKSLEKQRDRRYETAVGLARDVQRYLADEPVEARPPSPGYRLRKFARRHRAAVHTAAVVTVLVLAGTGISVWQAVRATRAEKQTAAERDATETARRQTRAALDAVTDDALADLLIKKATLTAADRQFLRKVLALYDDPAAAGGDDAESRLARAAGYRRVAAIRRRLGEGAEAEAAARQAAAAFRRLGQDDPADPRFPLGEALALRELLLTLEDRAEQVSVSREAVPAAERAFALQPADPEVREALGSALCDLGTSLSNTGAPDEAVEPHRRGIDVLRAVVRDFPDRSRYRARLAAGLSNATGLFEQVGRPADGEALAREALAEMERLCDDEPDNENHFANLALTWCNLGDRLRAQTRLDEAKDAVRRGAAVGDRASTRFPSAGYLRSAVTLRVLGGGYHLAAGLAAAGRPAEAEALLRDLVARGEALVARAPDDARHRDQFAVCCMALGELLLKRPDPADGERQVRRAVTELEAAVRLAPANTQYWNNLGGAFERLGTWLMAVERFADAEAAFRGNRAALLRLVGLEKATDAHRRLLAITHQRLGKALHSQNKLDAATACQRDAVAVAEARLADAPDDAGRRRDHTQMATVLANLLLGTGKPADAAAILVPLVDRQRKAAGGAAAGNDDLEGLALTLGALRNVSGARRKPVEARALGREALGIREKLVAADPNRIDYWLGLARMATAVGLETPAGPADVSARLAHLTRAREAMEKAVAVGGPRADLVVELAGNEVNEADTVRRRGKPEAALAIFDRAIRRLEPFVKADPPVGTARQFYVNAHLNRSLAHAALGHHREVIADVEAAAALDDKAVSPAERWFYMNSLAAGGRGTDAVAQAELLSRPADAPPGVLANCARVLAEAAAAEKDPAAKADRERRAVELLQRARAGGLFRQPESNKRIRDEPALKGLRDRDDFKQFLADLDKEPPPKAGPKK
jgi:eukaryotic-like serine/threonine-protein kinase